MNLNPHFMNTDDKKIPDTQDKPEEKNHPFVDDDVLFVDIDKSEKRGDSLFDINQFKELGAI